MLIRSQDKMSLVNYNTGGLCAYLNNTISYNFSNNAHIKLGYYESEIKTMQVLDLIEKAFLDNPNGIFYMPESNVM